MKDNAQIISENQEHLQNKSWNRKVHLFLSNLHISRHSYFYRSYILDVGHTVVRIPLQKYKKIINVISPYNPTTFDVINILKKLRKKKVIWDSTQEEQISV